MEIFDTVSIFRTKVAVLILYNNLKFLMLQVSSIHILYIYISIHIHKQLGRPTPFVSAEIRRFSFPWNTNLRTVTLS